MDPVSTKRKSPVSNNIELLEYMTANEMPIGITEISNLLGISRSTAYSLAKELEDREYILKLPNKKYTLTSKMYQLGTTYTNRYPIIRLIKNSNYSFLQGIAESVRLTILSGYSKAVILFNYSIDNDLDQTPPGYTIPLNTSACGKVLIAYALEPIREKFFENFPGKAYTEKSITSVEEYKKELDLLLEQKYAVDDEEYAVDQVCFAVPIKLSAITNEIGALSITGRKSRMMEGKEKVLRNLNVLVEMLSINQ